MSIPIDEIAGPDGQSFKFTTIGDTAKGIIIHAEKSQRTNQFNGKLEEVLRISLEQDDGETILLWPVTNTDLDGGGWASRMAKAIVAAVRAADRTTLETGGTLAVQYNEDHPTDHGNPAKGYVAEYKPPTAQVAVAAADPAGDGAVTGLI